MNRRPGVLVLLGIRPHRSLSGCCYHQGKTFACRTSRMSCARVQCTMSRMSYIKLTRRWLTSVPLKRSFVTICPLPFARSTRLQVPSHGQSEHVIGTRCFADNNDSFGYPGMFLQSGRGRAGCTPRSLPLDVFKGCLSSLLPVLCKGKSAVEGLCVVAANRTATSGP